MESGNELLLMIPLWDYPSIRAGRSGEMMLHLHEDYFEKTKDLPEYDLFCPVLIDLDKLHDLPWIEVPTVVGC